MNVRERALLASTKELSREELVDYAFASALTMSKMADVLGGAIGVCFSSLPFNVTNLSAKVNDRAEEIFKGR